MPDWHNLKDYCRERPKLPSQISIFVNSVYGSDIHDRILIFNNLPKIFLFHNGQQSCRPVVALVLSALLVFFHDTTSILKDLNVEFSH